MTKFNDYHVVLHNAQKYEKRRHITKCVSKDAAVRVANLLERIHNNGKYWASLVYEVGENGKPIYS